MTLVKKASKTFAIAISAVAAAAIMTTSAIAVSHVHHYNRIVDTVVYSSAVGTHSHCIGYFADGSPNLVQCTIIVDRHQCDELCDTCGAVGRSTTYNVERHTALMNN